MVHSSLLVVFQKPRYHECLTATICLFRFPQTTWRRHGDVATRQRCCHISRVKLEQFLRHPGSSRPPLGTVVRTDDLWTSIGRPPIYSADCVDCIYIVNLLHNKLSDVIRWRETSDLLSWEQGACLDFLTFHNKTILRKAVQSCFWWLTTDELHYIFYITSYSFSTRYQTGFTLMEVIFHRLLCLHTQYFTIFTQLWLRDVCRGILWNPALHCCELHVLGCLHIHSSEWYRPLTSD